MSHSTRPVGARKPRKDFPLFPHATGRWCKKCRGKLHYFGKVATDPSGAKALEEWLRVKDELLAGRTPKPKDDGRLTVADLCNRFLTSKDRAVDAGELSKQTRDGYYAACERMVRQWGKTRAVVDLTADDFEQLRAGIVGGAHYVANIVQRVRTCFKYGYDSGLLDRPVRFGPGFKKPSKRMFRLEKAERGAKLFAAADVRRLLAAADVHLRAMAYLGLNCGFGNHDCGTLPLEAVDLEAGWVVHHRGKTGIGRRCPLWPQTVRAIRRSLARRPTPKQGAEGLLFVTKYGQPWAKEVADSPVTKEFRKLLDRLGLHRPGLGFYCLRHCYRTAADGCGDQVAANSIMGHCDDSMAATYRERIDDERLVRCVQHVRQWLAAGRKAVQKQFPDMER